MFQVLSFVDIHSIHCFHITQCLAVCVCVCMIPSNKTFLLFLLYYYVVLCFRLSVVLNLCRFVSLQLQSPFYSFLIYSSYLAKDLVVSSITYIHISSTVFHYAELVVVVSWDEPFDPRDYIYMMTLWTLWSRPPSLTTQHRFV